MSTINPRDYRQRTTPSGHTLTFSIVSILMRATIQVLKSFKGNARICIAVEPMWGIPFHLFTTYTSLYMVAMGVTDTQIGLIASLSMGCQMIFSLMGGYITDRLGRRRTSLIFDLLSWTLPTLIWAFARNVTWFVVAAVFNALVRVVHVSWTCLFIEDTKPGDRVNVYTWIAVAGILAGFFAPIAGFLVGRFSLVPAVRGLYLFAFASMTTMFFLRNHFTHETAIGKKRMQETKGRGLIGTLRQYLKLIPVIFSNPVLLLAIGLAVLNHITIMVKTTFLGIILTRGIGLPSSGIAVFPAVNSIVTMTIFIFVMPSLGKRPKTRPMTFGYLLLIAGYLLLLFAPSMSYVAVFASVIVAAVGSAVVIPFIESNLANTIDDEQRAMVFSLVNTTLFGLTAPFGFFGGMLSAMNARFPLFLILGSLTLSLVLLGLQSRIEKRHTPQLHAMHSPSDD